jgi:hypothetical protein
MAMGRRVSMQEDAALDAAEAAEDAAEAGAYTRPLFSSTCTVSAKQIHDKHPPIPPVTS